MQIVNPLDIPVHQSWPTPLPMHTDDPFPENNAVANLADDMTNRGWIGSPVVVWGEDAYTGTHRIAAWEAIDGDMVPCVDIRDILNAYGLKLDRAAAEEIYGPDCPDVAVVATAVASLPTDIIDAYGLDLNP